MAEKLKTFSFDSRGDGRYDWKKLFDGSIWRLKHGEDFNCKVDSFKLIAYKKAKQIGLRLKINVDGDSLVMQAVDRK